MNKENRKYKKARKDAIKRTIARTELELKHYKHLLRRDDHILKECPLLKHEPIPERTPGKV